MKYFVSAPIIAFIALCSCSGQNPSEDQSKKQIQETVLASVGDVKITLSKFRQFSESIPDGMKKGDSVFAKERQVLESLIDKELLLIEAQSLPIEQETEFRDEVGMYSRNRLLELYTRRLVSEQIEISDEEMEAHYRATNRDRALRFNGIMLKSEDDALNMLKELEAGGDFMELKRKDIRYTVKAPSKVET